MSTRLTLSNLEARLLRRIARLLLRLDRQAFRGRFCEWYRQSDVPHLPELQAYDYVIRLLLHSEELFDDLLPRLQRQMSVQSTSDRRTEEPPLRGQIDWQRSLVRSWHTQPGVPPTRFETNQRSRSFATPENALLLAVLQHCARALRHAQSAPLIAHAPLTPDEQRQLEQSAEQVQRALAAPFLTEPPQPASAADLAALLEQVAANLPPGASPYRDLIEWWQRFEQLQMHSPGEASTRPVLDSHQRANLLYRLWFALELAQYLASEDALHDTRITTNRIELDFTWQGRAFHFVYQRQPTSPPPPDAPRSAYLIRRAAPLVIAHAGETIWREPDVLLDARYALPGETPPMPGDLPRLVLADMLLHQARASVLILPDTRYPIPDTPSLQTYQLRPLEQIEALHEHLRALLDQVAGWLPERPPVACYGMLQDPDTRNPHQTPPAHCSRCGSLLALCPKPHIAPERVDLVCPACDCLHTPHLCHILSTTSTPALMPPYVRRVLTSDQLVASIEQVRQRLRQRFAPTDESDQAEHARSALLDTIGSLIESYTGWKQGDPLLAQIEEKLGWAFGTLWRADQHPRGLPEEVRNMLISGEYVWNEFQQAGMKDWAACAVQYVRALERELHRRLYAPCGAPSALRYYDQPMIPHQFTYGTISRAFRKRFSEHPDPNWYTLVQYAAEPSGADLSTFEEIVAEIARLRKNRNKIAHSERIDRAIAGTARSAILGQPQHPGVLRRFIALLDPG